MPRTGRPKQFHVTKLVKLTTEQVAAVRAYSDAHGVNESEAIRRLIELGLRAQEAAVDERVPQR